MNCTAWECKLCGRCNHIVDTRCERCGAKYGEKEKTMAKYRRSKIEIIRDVLSVCGNDGATLADIRTEALLDYGLAVSYLGTLMEKGFVLADRSRVVAGRKYVLTIHGKVLLAKINKVEEMVGELL